MIVFLGHQEVLDRVTELCFFAYSGELTVCRLMSPVDPKHPEWRERERTFIGSALHPISKIGSAFQNFSR